MPKKNQQYIVVFDMDETLGHFEQLSIFWDVLNDYFKKKYNKKIDKKELYNIIDNFDKILRPKILNILEYLKRKKESKLCDKVIIFTNNTSKEWSNLISNYFNYKLEYNLIDQVIAAYKSKGKLIEPNRTQYDKSFIDLINCTKLPEDTQVCFFDDVMHPDMEHKNVVYLKIKPYVYSYKNEDMIDNYYKKYLYNLVDKKDFLNNMKDMMNLYEYKYFKKSDLEQKIDILLSKRLMEHLDIFFKGKKQKLFTL
jgi:hypothetical protein